MKIVHVLNNKAIEKDVADSELSFFLSSGNGGFAHFSTAHDPTSKYQGLFTKIGSGIFKTIEHLNPLAEEKEEKVAAIENTGYAALFHRSSFYESFFMPMRKNSLVYQLSMELPVELFFDVRKANDLRQWGRHYNVVEAAGNTVVIQFTKKTDNREDSSSGNIEYEIFVAVKHDGFISNINSGWVKRDYSLDKKRNSTSERYVYKAATIAARTFVISAAASAAAAAKEAESVFKSIDRLKKESKKHYDSLCSNQSNNETAMAANAARIALDKLTTKEGLYAGLPWFFQEWSRDELVSCAALPVAARKRIVLSYLDKILDDGRLPTTISRNYGNSHAPHSSADGVGWLFKRDSDLIDEKRLAAAEIKKLRAGLKKSIDGTLQRHSKNGFITSEKNETWMDTSFDDNGRKGACIEVQAMQLNMYGLMYKLSKEKTYLLLEKSLRQNVRKFFWNGTLLADRLNDSTARPNIFIAAYVYPQLLSRKEWETCISNSLQLLWLEWGGISTIDRIHKNFRNEYTGETNESYHRGDSWFWINNIAAIVMANVNRKKFENYIEKVVAAGTNDILWKGAIGCSSELSSAKEQRAEGCLNQAWSAATFVELLKTLKRQTIYRQGH